MIFVTVGTQLPFDRLIMAVDRWAEMTGTKVIAQTGETHLKPTNLEIHSSFSPDEFIRIADQSEIIVAHAGMGSILTAMELCKPIIIMPRMAKLNEHRNDHQLATARRFTDTRGIYIAWDEKELARLLQEYKKLAAGSGLSPDATPELLDAVKSFIESN